MTERSIRETVLGPHYAMLQSLASSGYGPGLAALIDPEISTRYEELVEALKELDAAAASWGSDRMAIILDTNVLLAAGPRVAKIDWDKVLSDGLGRAVFTIPIQVVEELDRLKDRGPDKQRDQARYALKWLDSLSLYGDRSEPFETTSPSTTIRVWVDENNRVPLAEVDRDIIDRALQLAPFTKKTVIASMDRSMVMRARTYGLAAALLEEDDIPTRSTQSQRPVAGTP